MTVQSIAYIAMAAKRLSTAQELEKLRTLFSRDKCPGIAIFQFQIRPKSFIECFHANNCPLLMEGKLYPCTVAPNVCHFNKRFGTNLELKDGDSLDIYHVKKASELLKFLSRPKPFCRHCDVGNRSYGHKWERSKQEISEWVT